MPAADRAWGGVGWGGVGWGEGRGVKVLIFEKNSYHFSREDFPSISGQGFLFLLYTHIAHCALTEH